MTEKRLDRHGAPFFLLDTGDLFRPGLDVLTFLSNKPKAARHAPGTDAIARQLILASRAKLRRQRDALAVALATALAVAGAALALALV